MADTIGLMPSGKRNIIRCVETDKIYKSFVELAEDMCYSPTHVRHCVKESKEINGLHFEVIRNASIGQCFKKVKCRTTNVIYESLTEAAKHTGISITSISLCVNGHQGTAGGYEWQFV